MLKTCQKLKIISLLGIPYHIHFVFVSFQTATGSWVGQVIEGLAGFDRDTMTLCESDGEYKVAYNNRVYPTCVAYGAPSSLCTDDNLICPEWRDEGVFGFVGNQRAALAAAFLRNDFRHQGNNQGATLTSQKCTTIRRVIFD